MGSSKEVHSAVFILMMMFCSSCRAQNIRNDGTTLLLRNFIDTLAILSLQLQGHEGKIKAMIEDQEGKIKAMMEDQEGKIKAMMEVVEAKLAHIEESQQTMEADMKQQQEMISSLQQCSNRDQISELQDLIQTGQQQLGRSIGQCSTTHQISEFQDVLTRDECQDGSHNCSDMATCTDALYQYKCSCRPGYSGDGFTCEDVDECRENVDNCGDDMVCDNYPGTYACNKCSKYFKKVGDTCQGPVCESPSLLLLPDLGCLTIVQEWLNWEDAKSKCQQMGLRLAEDITRQHMETISQHFYPLNQNGNFPVGFWDGRWLTSGEEVKEEDWLEGQPNGGICGYFRVTPPTVGFFDYTGLGKDYVLCQSLP